MWVLPDANIEYYEDLLKLLKNEFPNVLIHGFSPTMIYDASLKSEMDIDDSLKVFKKSRIRYFYLNTAEILTTDQEI